MELYAANDGNPQTEPWTDLIVKHWSIEATFAAIGALMLWLPLHFWLRYRKRRRL
ncbi:MAG TPA: hypothetical protein VIV12_13390 [Streptosporangiaceae bacterium]